MARKDSGVSVEEWLGRWRSGVIEGMGGGVAVFGVLCLFFSVFRVGNLGCELKMLAGRKQQR